jgi:hydrogenase expression/formation protein HypD
MESIARKIIDEITRFNNIGINLMEVCGTHTMAIAKAGLRGLMPENIRLLSGPGCPVCVTPQETIDYAIALAQLSGVTIATFGDMVRVPGSTESLEMFSPKIVYSPLDALQIAQTNPRENVIFVGVGFETTSPTVAATILAAEKNAVENFYILPAFKCIPPALKFIAQNRQINVQGFILPGHVSTIIGSQPYEFLATQYGIPGCITGFEPIDILGGIFNLVKQIANKNARIDIEYRRVVNPEGNKKAQEILRNVFEPCDARWRGIGIIPQSGMALRPHYRKYDASRKFEVEVAETREPAGCICGKVLLGLNIPPDCALFGKTCTPLSPIGPCMVSSEGSCAAYYKYGDYKYLKTKMPKLPKIKKRAKKRRKKRGQTK